MSEEIQEFDRDFMKSVRERMEMNDDNAETFVCTCSKGLHDGKRIDCNCKCHEDD